MVRRISINRGMATLMMTRLLKRTAPIVPALLLLFAHGPARAAFESLEVDPRARAMGGAYTGMNGGWLALYHNPAALSETGNFELGASYVQPFGVSFLKLTTGGAVLPISQKLGGLGIGFRRLATEHLDQELNSENTFSLAHGFQLHEDVSTIISFGYALNLYNQEFGGSVNGVDPGSATAFGIDLAARVTLRNRTSVGFLAQNLNNPTIGDEDIEELPRRVIGGVAYYPYREVLTTFDLDHVLGEKPRFRGGAEFQLAEWVALRTGIATDPGLWSGGFGVNWKGIRVDYGFSTGPGPLEESHQVGLSLLPSRLGGGD
jgi:hypothetical protein